MVGNKTEFPAHFALCVRDNGNGTNRENAAEFLLRSGVVVLAASPVASPVASSVASLELAACPVVASLEAAALFPSRQRSMCGAQIYWGPQAPETLLSQASLGFHVGVRVT
jgi:hypothetical protein